MLTDTLERLASSLGEEDLDNTADRITDEFPQFAAGLNTTTAVCQDFNTKSRYYKIIRPGKIWTSHS